MLELSALPLETLVHILKYLDAVTLGKCRRVSKVWKDVIDENDRLWYLACRRDFRCSSKVAKKKAAITLRWYNIYKNLKMWSNVTSYELKVRNFYEFQLNDKFHSLDIDCSILPLKDTRGIVLYDMSTMRHLPVAIPDKNCQKIAHNETSTVVLLQHGLMIQRKVENQHNMSEAFFDADNFILTVNSVYFYKSRDVYKCDLTKENLSSILLYHSEYDLKEIEYNDDTLIAFTLSGKIILFKNQKLSVLPISLPIEWIQHIKLIKAIDEKNFVCFSRNLFKIETDKYQHLFLDFPPITALFFYGDDIVLIGTKVGEILLYKLSSQKRATTPIFEKLATLPEGKFAVQIDVAERSTGPVIVIATFFEIMVIEIDFFPDLHTKIILFKNQKLSVLPISLPIEWIQHIKLIKAIDEKNFVCFSRNLFKIETDKYQHLFLDFPPITALFFYGDDIVLIGTKVGEILLYKLSSQKRATTPIFEKLATLPEGKFAVQIDVAERSTGPVIVIATFFEIMVIEIDFFPDEKPTKVTFSQDKQSIYKRLLRIRDRIQMY